MDKKARTLLPCALLLCLLAWRAAGGGETADETGLHLLDKLIAEGLVLSTDADSAAERFQFRYHHSVRIEPNRASHTVVIIEGSHNQAAALLCTGGGIPYAHVAGELLSCAVGPRSEMIGLPGAVFRFRVSNHADMRYLYSINNFGVPSSVRLGLSELLRNVRAEAGDPEPNHLAQRLLFGKENGSTAIVRLSRERTPGGFPIASIVLRTSDGAFIAVTDIVVNREACWSISKPLPALAELAPPLTEELVTEKYGPIGEAIGWVVDQRAASYVRRDVRRLVWGGLMLFCFPVRDDITADERQVIETAIESLQPRMVGYVVGDARTQAYRDLEEVLQRKIVQPANLVDPRPGAVVRYVTGRDRHRTATALEVRLRPALARSVYAVLRETITDRRMTDEQRAMTLDLLGEIGIPELSNGLVEVSEALEADPPQLVRVALASAKARTGVPTDDDVKLLREAVADRATPDRWRAVWLEALLLMDEAEGLQPVIADVLGRALGQDRDEFAKRCLLAAGCSDDGREVLLRLARGDGKEPPPVELMRVLSTAIMPGDRQWDDWLALARQFAVAETLDADSRWIAEDVVARADSWRQGIKGVRLGDHRLFTEEQR